jgi:diketogulonate reductase-like aldo/keto reductase
MAKLAPLLLALECLVVATTVPFVPTVKLRNGVEMPMLATGVYQYNVSEAYASISAWLKVGGRSIDTALDYWNQQGVGKAMKDSGIPREEIFLQTKVPGCANPAENTTRNPFTCYRDTKKNLASDLELLGLDYVDSVIIHFPPFPSFAVRSCGELTGSCTMVREQWRAMEEFYKAGKAKSIGVSNYCPSCFECLAHTDVFPFTNQVMFHLGMGPNSGIEDILTYSKKKGVITQAYSSLGNTPWAKHANPDILHGNVTSAIAANHNVSTVEIALKYVVDKGIPSVTKSSNPAHLASNLGIFAWNLTNGERDTLDKYVLPGSRVFDKYSFACNSMESTLVV